MSRSTKSQFYRNTLRTAAIADTSFCTDKVYLYPVPPQNCLSIESIFFHLRMQFDAGVATADQVVEYIAIANQRPLFINDEPTRMRKIDLNVAADGNRRVDILIDLSSLLKTDDVGFTSLWSADYEIGDQTHILIKLPDSLRSTLAVGTIEICKVDCLYTTTEIR